MWDTSQDTIKTFEEYVKTKSASGSWKGPDNGPVDLNWWSGDTQQEVPIKLPGSSDNRDTPIVSKPAFGTFSSADRCGGLMEREITISINLVSRMKHDMLYNFLVDGCIDFGNDKTQLTSTNRWHSTQIITDCVTFTLDFKQLGFVPLPSSSRHRDRDFSYKWNANFNQKRTLEHWASLVLFHLTPCVGFVGVYWLLFHWLQVSAGHQSSRPPSP